MNHARNSTAWLLVAGLFISLSAQAQKIEVGAGVGGMLYKGDVSPALNPRFYRPAANLFFRYNASRSFSLRAGLGIGSLGATDRFSRDPFRQARGYSFRSSLSEATFDLQYNFLNYKLTPKVKNWTPYVFGGVGLCSFRNPVVRARGIINFPLGIGMKYEINRPWSVGLEFGTRFTKHDYLDGLGERTYGVTTNKIAQGNPALRDSYTYTAFTVSYTFYKIVCP
ncbi:type IX secretion system protein PorG [Spirosoma arcticum]